MANPLPKKTSEPANPRPPPHLPPFPAPFPRNSAVAGCRHAPSPWRRKKCPKTIAHSRIHAFPQFPSPLFLPRQRHPKSPYQVRLSRPARAGRDVSPCGCSRRVSGSPSTFYLPPSTCREAARLSAPPHAGALKLYAQPARPKSGWPTTQTSLKAKVLLTLFRLFQTHFLPSTPSTSFDHSFSLIIISENEFIKINSYN